MLILFIIWILIWFVQRGWDTWIKQFVLQVDKKGGRIYSIEKKKKCKMW